MPTREEMEAALRETGSNYSLPDDYSAMAASAPVDYSPAPVQTPVSQPAQPSPAPEPMMSEAPPTPPPAAEPAPSMPRPAHKAPAAKQLAPAAPAVEPQRPEPEAGHVTDADILGLTRGGKGAAPSAIAPDAAPAAPQQLEDKSVNVSAPTKALTAETRARESRQGELIGEQADAIEAGGSQRHAIDQARADNAVQGINDAKDRSQEHSERAEQTRQDIIAQREELKQKMGKPPFDTVGLVMGLVGALAAAHGKTAAGQMLAGPVSQAINSRMNRWKGEIEGGQQNQEGLGKLVNMDRLAAADEDQAAGAIQKAMDAEFSAAMDEAGKQLKDEGQINALKQMRNQFDTQLLKSEQDRRAKAAAAAHRRMVNSKIANATTEEERKHIAESYGDVGRSIDKANLANDMTRAKEGSELLGQQKISAETMLAQANARKEEAKANGEPYTGFIPGKKFTRDLSPQIESKIADKTMAYGGLRAGYDRLFQLSEQVKKNGGRFDANMTQEVAQIKDDLVGQSSNFFGKGAPTGDEYEKVISGIADPQKWLQRADSAEVLKRSLRNITSNYDTSLKGLGIYDENDPAAKGSSGGGRRVKFSDGQVMELSSDQIQALQAQGSKLEAVD